MGQCGCGDYSGVARFPGPGDSVYVLEFYTGCPDCHTGPGLQINRFNAEQAKTWDVARLPELHFQDWSEATGWGNVGIPVIDPDLMRARLHMFEAESPGEYEIEGFVDDATGDALRDASYDTFEHWALRWLRRPKTDD